MAIIDRTEIFLHALKIQHEYMEQGETGKRPWPEVSAACEALNKLVQWIVTEVNKERRDNAEIH